MFKLMTLETVVIGKSLVAEVAGGEEEDAAVSDSGKLAEVFLSFGLVGKCSHFAVDARFDNGKIGNSAGLAGGFGFGSLGGGGSVVNSLVVIVERLAVARRRADERLATRGLARRLFVGPRIVDRSLYVRILTAWSLVHMTNRGLTSHVITHSLPHWSLSGSLRSFLLLRSRSLQSRSKGRSLALPLLGDRQREDTLGSRKRARSFGLTEVILPNRLTSGWVNVNSRRNGAIEDYRSVSVLLDVCGSGTRCVGLLETRLELVNVIVLDDNRGFLDLVECNLRDGLVDISGLNTSSGLLGMLKNNDPVWRLTADQLWRRELLDIGSMSRNGGLLGASHFPGDELVDKLVDDVSDHGDTGDGRLTRPMSLSDFSWLLVSVEVEDCAIL